MANKKLSFALAGNPNCGKTTLFNSLTGATAHVGNWPGVTVEKRSGTYKRKGKQEVEIVDLPGIYSLSPYTPEEVISRNYILENKPDVVINVLDATNLERNLYMTTQILEMDVPVVIALNMIDALEEQKITIDAEGLSKKLGVPVVSISALRRKNLDELIEKAIEASKEKREGVNLWASSSETSEKIQKAKEIYANEGVENCLFHATKALEGDDLEKEKNSKACEKVQELYSSFEEFEASSADQRYKFITNELATLRVGVEKKESKKLSKSDKIDKVLTNRWAAIPILIVIMFFVFHLTFSEDLFYLGSMGVDFGEGYTGLIAIGDYHPFEGLFWTSDGINSIGTILANLLNGITGLINYGVGELLGVCGAADWATGLVCDGILEGVFAVLGFLPQILVLFLFFAILEDSGYMARVAFVLDRIFRRFGVSGRAFLPMIMGFGCGVPAMINTRTLSSDKERIKTIRVIPFFACSAKLPIIVAIAGALAAAGGLDAGILTFLCYVIGFAAAIIAVILMNKTSQREEVPPFIMELPAYHMPQAKALLIHIWDKAKHFIKKAFTIILATTVLVWVFSNFTWDWHFIPSYEETYSELGYSTYEALESNSILACIGKLVQPLFTPAGFGSQTGTNGWAYSVAAINGLIAKENVVGTLGTLGAVLTGGEAFEEGAEAMEAIMSQTTWTTGGMVSFIIFNLLTIPCFASVATAKGELPNRKSYLWTLLFWLATSYLTATAFYLMIDWWWTTFIIVPIFILLVVLCVLYDRRKKAKTKEAEVIDA